MLAGQKVLLQIISLKLRPLTVIELFEIHEEAKLVRNISIRPGVARAVLKHLRNTLVITVSDPFPPNLQNTVFPKP